MLLLHVFFFLTKFRIYFLATPISVRFLRLLAVGLLKRPVWSEADSPDFNPIDKILKPLSKLKFPYKFHN